jgi:hypothetical protein
MRGLSDANGSWKTIWRLRRSGRSSRCSSPGGRPSNAPAGRRRDEVEQQPRRGRLPAARLADETERAVRHQVERHAVDGTHLRRRSVAGSPFDRSSKCFTRSTALEQGGRHASSSVRREADRGARPVRAGRRGGRRPWTSSRTAGGAHPDELLVEVARGAVLAEGIDADEVRLRRGAAVTRGRAARGERAARSAGAAATVVCRGSG